MALLWDETFVLGIDEIDEQHRTIIEEFTGFSEAIQAGTARELLSETALFLVKYAEEHFATEENYMQKYEYPRIEEQRLEHQNFTADAEELVKKIEEEGASRELAAVLAGKMIRWVIQHIRNHDRDMVTYIIERMKAE